ncbi:MAG TPA: AarF/UbiB family protein [Baekduia sp.]
MAAPSPEKPSLPPAVRSLLEAGGSLVRRSSSGRVGMGRAAAVARAGVLPRALGRLAAELEAAQAESAQPVAFKDIEKVLRGAWGRPPDRVLDALDPEPLAVTPSAQVHRGVRDDGTAVAVKVLRPGLAAAVRNDLALLDVLGPPLRQVFGAMDAGAVLRAVRETALDELDLEHEASTQRQVRRVLRSVDGLVVPAPDLELSGPDVLVSELLAGPTLATALPDDPAAVARTLVEAHVIAARAGLVLTDPRPGHVVLCDDGSVGLLGAGLARPVDRARVTAALAALVAWRAGDQDGCAAAVADGLGLLPRDAALKAYAFSAVVLGTALSGDTLLDDATASAIGDRALSHLPAGLLIAAELTPHPEDIAVARAIGQLTSVLALLGAEQDWGALVLAAGAGS